MQDSHRFKYSALVSPARQAAIGPHERRSTSFTSQISALSVASSTVSDFLAEKIRFLESQRGLLLEYQKGLFETRDQMSAGEFRAELENIGHQIEPVQSSLSVLQNQTQATRQDIADDIISHKRPWEDGLDVDFYERAYAKTLRPHLWHDNVPVHLP